MKKFNHTFLLIVLMSMFEAKMFAYDAKIGGIYYNINSSEGTATVTSSNDSGYNSYWGDVVIPETIDYNNKTYYVTSVEGSAFRGSSGLTSVKLPKSITSIGNLAFSECVGLKSIDIPNNVTSIGYDAFYGCSGLTSVTIPNSVKSIESGAFKGCSSLTSVTIPSSVTDIGSEVFINCSRLTKVTLNSTIVSKPYASNLTLSNKFGSQVREYIIGDNVTSIGKYAFNGCSSLTSVTIGKSVTRIGEYAFRYCSNLTSVHISDLVAWCDILFCAASNESSSVSSNPLTYAKHLFMNGKEIKEVIIPNSVTSISDYAFYGIHLNTLIVGAGVLSLGKSAFTESPVKTIWLTNTPPQNYIVAQGKVNYVANNNYSNLSNKTVYPFLSSMFEVNGIRYVPVSPSDRTCDGIDCVYDESSENITIGENVTNKGISLKIQKILPYLCYENTYIKNVNIEYGYKGDVIGNSFRECTSITSATINNQGNVGSDAFLGCTSLNTIIISNHGDIGSGAFSGCTGITSATISNQGSIGEKAFYGCATSGDATFVIENTGSISTSAFEGCTSITSATISNKGSIGEKAFYGCATKNPATFVINNKGNILKSAFEGCTKMTNVELGDEIPTIGERAFYGCSKLNNIVIPDAVTSIGSYAFCNCSNLSFAKIGSGIKSIPSYTFSGCYSLEDVQIGKNVASIGGYAFNRCSALPKIQIPQSVTSIADYVFQGCKGLKTVIMDNGDSDLSLSSNGSNPLFVDCSLDSVYIGRNITYSTSSDKGYSPFYRNTSLRTVVITDKETEISDNEFYGCTNLQSFKVGDGVTTFGKYAFSGCSSLKSLSFGAKLQSIGQEAFSDCTAITSILSKATTPPTCGTQALDDINKWECNLKVPEGTLPAYQAANQWKEFFFVAEGSEETIPDEQEPTVNKCATPTISVADGVLQFDCETEGVKFISRIIPPTAFSSEEEQVTIPTTYKITVYAVKEGFENSDIVTKEIDLSGISSVIKGDVNEDGIVNGTDIQEVINIIVGE